jgi:hypothetical protein
VEKGSVMRLLMVERKMWVKVFYFFFGVSLVNVGAKILKKEKEILILLKLLI